MIILLALVGGSAIFIRADEITVSDIDEQLTAIASDLQAVEEYYESIKRLIGQTEDAESS